MIMTNKDAFYIKTKNVLKDYDWTAVRRILADLVRLKYISLERFKRELNPLSERDKDLCHAVKDLQAHPDRNLFEGDPLTRGERDVIKCILSHPGASKQDVADKAEPIVISSKTELCSRLSDPNTR